MAPTGRSGANDAEMANLGTSNDFADSAADALGEPIGLIEVVEFESLEPAASSPSAYPEEDASWFRWWYVPAVVAPIAGATAAFMLLRRRRRQAAPVAAYRAAMKQSRDWLDTMRSSKATKSAVNALAQGAATVRKSAKSLPDTAVALRDRSGEIVGVVVTSAAAKQASRGLRDAAESVTSLWSATPPKASRADRRSVFMLFRADQPRTVKANRTVERVRPVVLAARNNASKNMAQATARTNRTAKRAQKSVNRAMDRTRAFAFGALVTATVTYARAWRKRMMERETISGNA